MNKPFPDNPDHRRHRREKATIDHLVERVFEPKARKTVNGRQRPTAGHRSRSRSARNGTRNKAAVSRLSDHQPPALKK